MADHSAGDLFIVKAFCMQLSYPSSDQSKVLPTDLHALIKRQCTTSGCFLRCKERDSFHVYLYIESEDEDHLLEIYDCASAETSDVRIKDQ